MSMPNMVDTMTMDLLPSMAKACTFIDEQLALPVFVSPFAPAGSPDSRQDTERQDSRADAPSCRGVLVRCYQGVSWSATIAIVRIMRKKHETLNVVLAEVIFKRKVRPNENFWSSSGSGRRNGYEVWLDEKNIPKSPTEPSSTVGLWD